LLLWWEETHNEEKITHKPHLYVPHHIYIRREVSVFVVLCCTVIHSFFFLSYIHQYEHGIHRSDAEVLINKVPVIEVAGHVAVCDGGGGALGHPVEFIQLDNVSSEPAICKYCGLRFKMKAGGHHH
jgi:NADH dehydrogenase (ubiquinone) Fe-S protein 6